MMEEGLYEEKAVMTMEGAKSIGGRVGGIPFPPDRCFSALCNK
jgi:hypothetical protein